MHERTIKGGFFEELKKIEELFRKNKPGLYGGMLIPAVFAGDNC